MDQVLKFFDYGVVEVVCDHFVLARDVVHLGNHRREALHARPSETIERTSIEEASLGSHYK